MIAKELENAPLAAGHTGKNCTFVTGIRQKAGTGGHPRCPELATFAITKFGQEQPSDLVCGRHLTPACRELSELTNKALVVQEIPIRQRRKYR